MLEQKLLIFRKIFQTWWGEDSDGFFFWERTQIHFLAPTLLENLIDNLQTFWTDKKKAMHDFFSEKMYNYIILLPFCSKILIDVRWIVQTVFDLIGRTVWTNFFEENLQLYELTPILFENFGWCSPICFRPLDQKTFWTIYHLRAITALSSCSYLAIKLMIDVLQSAQMVFVL